MIGLKALTNLRMNVLKMSRSSKLLSVLGTSENNTESNLFIFVFLSTHTLIRPFNFLDGEKKTSLAETPKYYLYRGNPEIQYYYAFYSICSVMFSTILSTKV